MSACIWGALPHPPPPRFSTTYEPILTTAHSPRPPLPSVKSSTHQACSFNTSHGSLHLKWPLMGWEGIKVLTSSHKSLLIFEIIKLHWFWVVNPIFPHEPYFFQMQLWWTWGFFPGTHDIRVGIHIPNCVPGTGKDKFTSGIASALKEHLLAGSLQTLSP